jgi:hypothetical protein
MSRTTYTKRGSPKVLKVNDKGNLYRTEGSLPIAMAPFRYRVLWNLGNLFGFNNIRQNANKSRGFGIQEELYNKVTKEFESRTSTAFNFGRWVGYFQKVTPKRNLWYKRTVVDNYDWDFTPVNRSNTSMQSLRVQITQGNRHATN